MKDELQSKLVEILGSIQTAAGKAGDFAISQLPDIAQSYVVYGRAKSVVSIAFASVLLFLAFKIYCGIRAHCVGKKDLMDCEPGIVIIGGFGMCCLALAGAALMHNGISSAALVWLAPKVWLLKEIASLVK